MPPQLTDPIPRIEVNKCAVFHDGAQGVPQVYSLILVNSKDGEIIRVMVPIKRAILEM